MIETYKRTKCDSPLKCPYCNKQFRMNYDRQMSYIHKPLFGLNLTECKSCRKQFYYRNLSAEFARKTNMRAVFTIEEIIN